MCFDPFIYRSLQSEETTKNHFRAIFSCFLFHRKELVELTNESD